MNTCETCRYWERKKKEELFLLKFHIKEKPSHTYEEITEDANDYPSWATLDEKKCLGLHVFDFGDCSCPKFIYEATRHYDLRKQYDPGALYYTDGEEYGAWFETGKDFGCIYWKAKE